MSSIDVEELFLTYQCLSHLSLFWFYFFLFSFVQKFKAKLGKKIAGEPIKYSSTQGSESILAFIGVNFFKSLTLRVIIETANYLL